MKKFTSFLLVIIYLIKTSSAQAIYGTECKKSYPEIGFNLSMRCNVVEEKKKDNIVSISNSVKDKTKQRDFEKTIINLNKLKEPAYLTPNQPEQEGKKALEAVLKSATGIRDILWLTGSLYGKKLYYNIRENRAEYRQYVLFKLDGADFILEFNFHLYFDNGAVSAFAEYYTMQDITSSLANDLRNGKESYWLTFYSSPYNIEYKRDTLIRRDALEFGFSLISPRHYLYVFFDSASHQIVFTPLGIWDELKAKDKKFSDITIRLVKKLNTNETFNSYAATFTKQSPNNKLNDPGIKALNKNINNVLTFTEMLVEDPKRTSHPYHPYKIQFEWNKSVFEISGDVTQHEILKDIYASITPLIYINPQNDANSSANLSQQILNVMDAWYTSLLDNVKKEKLPHVPLTGPDVTRYTTDLKLGNFTTYILQGMLPVDYRYWVAVVGTFNNKEEANAELRKWIPYFDEYKTELFSLSKSTASPNKILWKPKILDRTKVQDYFTNMEVIVERAEVLQSDKIIHEVYVKIGSPLNF